MFPLPPNAQPSTSCFRNKQKEDFFFFKVKLLYNMRHNDMEVMGGMWIKTERDTNLPPRDEQYGTTCIPRGPCSPEISTVFVRLQTDRQRHYIKMNLHQKKAKKSWTWTKFFLSALSGVNTHTLTQTLNSCSNSVHCVYLPTALSAHFSALDAFPCVSAYSILGMVHDYTAGEEKYRA